MRDLKLDAFEVTGEVGPSCIRVMAPTVHEADYVLGIMRLAHCHRYAVPANGHRTSTDSPLPKMSDSDTESDAESAQSGGETSATTIDIDSLRQSITYHRMVPSETFTSLADIEQPTTELNAAMAIASNNISQALDALPGLKVAGVVKYGKVDVISWGMGRSTNEFHLLVDRSFKTVCQARCSELLPQTAKVLLTSDIYRLSIWSPGQVKVQDVTCAVFIFDLTPIRKAWLQTFASSAYVVSAAPEGPPASAHEVIAQQSGGGGVYSFGQPFPLGLLALRQVSAVDL